MESEDLATTNYNLPTITGNMNADVVRDMNALAEATDAAIKTAVDGVDLSAVEGEIADVGADLAAHLAEKASHVKTTRYVIGTATVGWQAKDCNYLCTGVNDQTVINQAINDLPASGGEIVILDGEYNLSAPILINKNNVSLIGKKPILKRLFNSNAIEGLITLVNVEYCSVTNVVVNGNKSQHTSSNNAGILLTGSSNILLRDNIVNDNASHGIRLIGSSNNNIINNTCRFNQSGIYGVSGTGGIITTNTCRDNAEHGIALMAGSNNNTVLTNVCNANDGNGIHLEGCRNNGVANNTCNNNNDGIHSSSGNNNNIGNNTLYNNKINGILLVDTSLSIITGNTCIRSNGVPTDYTSSQQTIHVSGQSNNNNIIRDNSCMGKAAQIDGGTGNTIMHNKWDATNDDKSKFKLLQSLTLPSPASSTILSMPADYDEFKIIIKEADMGNAGVLNCVFNNGTNATYNQVIAQNNEPFKSAPSNTLLNLLSMSGASINWTNKVITAVLNIERSPNGGGAKYDSYGFGSSTMGHKDTTKSLGFWRSLAGEQLTEVKINTVIGAGTVIEVWGRSRV